MFPFFRKEKRMLEITLKGKKFPALFSVSAMSHICEHYNCDVSEIFNQFAGKPVNEITKGYTYIISELINGAYRAESAESGEKPKQITAEYICDIVTPLNIIQLRPIIISAFNESVEYEVPRGVQIEEPDIDLMEIDKEKNVESGATVETVTSA